MGMPALPNLPLVETPVSSNSLSMRHRPFVHTSTNMSSPTDNMASSSGISSTPTTSTPSVSNSTELAGQPIPFPFIYTLPKLPNHLLASLERAKSKADLDTTSKHALLRYLYDDLVQYTL